eukprot:COSAG06_NODE_9584_length_1864_cov_110.394901_1_plen_77_part_00
MAAVLNAQLTAMLTALDGAAAGLGNELDVIHIAIVCGKRDLLELRIGSIRSLDLLGLICLSASQQGQCDESIWPAA